MTFVDGIFLFTQIHTLILLDWSFHYLIIRSFFHFYRLFRFLLFNYAFPIIYIKHWWNGIICFLSLLLKLGNSRFDFIDGLSWNCNWLLLKCWSRLFNWWLFLSSSKIKVTLNDLTRDKGLFQWLGLWLLRLLLWISNDRLCKFNLTLRLGFMNCWILRYLSGQSHCITLIDTKFILCLITFILVHLIVQL